MGCVLGLVSQAALKEASDSAGPRWTYPEVCDGFIQILRNPLYHAARPLWRSIADDDLGFEFDDQLLDAEGVVVQGEPVHGGQARDRLLSLQVVNVGVGDAAPEHVGLELGDAGMRYPGHFHRGRPRAHALVCC